LVYLAHLVDLDPLDRLDRLHVLDPLDLQVRKLEMLWGVVGRAVRQVLLVHHHVHVVKSYYEGKPLHRVHVHWRNLMSEVQHLQYFVHHLPLYGGNRMKRVQNNPL